LSDRQKLQARTPRAIAHNEGIRNRTNTVLESSEVPSGTLRERRKPPHPAGSRLASTDFPQMHTHGTPMDYEFAVKLIANPQSPFPIFKTACRRKISIFLND